MEAEDYAPNEPARCDPTEKPGVQHFRSWVLQRYGGACLGIVRACKAGDGQTSKHIEGRAWDWQPPDNGTAKRLLVHLHQNADELMRRAGVRVVIYNRRMWVADRRAWRPYTGPDPHTGHVHFDFSRAGAMGQTSFYAEDGYTTLGDVAPTGHSPVVPPARFDCELPPTKTPFSSPKEGLLRALALGHRNALGTEPSARALGVAWAQVSLETGRTRNMFNWNMANLTPGRGYPGCVHKLELPASEPPYYRAYRTADDGAADYWRFLQSKRYSKAWPYFDAGDPRRAAFELGTAGFFTADKTKYADAMASLYREIMGVEPPGSAGSGAPSAPWWKAVLIGGLLVGAGIATARYG